MTTPTPAPAPTTPPKPVQAAPAAPAAAPKPSAAAVEAEAQTDPVGALLTSVKDAEPGVLSARVELPAGTSDDEAAELVGKAERLLLKGGHHDADVHAESEDGALYLHASF